VRRWVTELADADDVTLTKGDRPTGYPEPIVDHSAERSEALRRYQSMN
jgi:deoxyribodipyrimidine photo-lyase